MLSSAEYSRSITDNDAIGTGRITVSDKAGGNYEIATTSQTFDIGAPTPPPTVYTSTEIKITADKTTAAAGDVITFTITMGACFRPRLDPDEAEASGWADRGTRFLRAGCGVAGNTRL